MKTNGTNVLLITALIAGISGYSIAVFAHSGATGVIKERMELMGNIGKAQKSLVAMFSGKKTYNSNKVKSAAQIISQHAGDKISKLFPEGSIKHPSEALPAIWTSWKEFQHLSNELAVYADALAANAGNKIDGHSAKKKSTMMGQSGMGASTMMGGGKTSVKEQVKMLASMPPMASFQKLAETCTACHSKFRVKKK